jgi:hypothetical protein
VVVAVEVAGGEAVVGEAAGVVVVGEVVGEAVGEVVGEAAGVVGKLI